MSSLSRPELRDRLVVLRARVDAHFAAARELSPVQLRCRSGCAACCHARFSVFALEAEPIRQALGHIAREDAPLRQRIRAQADDPAHEHRCALLVDDRCSVYAARPAICRSQGLPLLTEDQLDWCRLNFTEEIPPRESILRLDALDRPLAALAIAWDGGQRVELSQLARED